MAAVDVRAMCHVTGGGLDGNLPRVLASGYRIDRAAWPEPPEVAWLRSLGVADDALYDPLVHGTRRG